MSKIILEITFSYDYIELVLIGNTFSCNLIYYFYLTVLSLTAMLSKLLRVIMKYMHKNKTENQL